MGLSVFGFLLLNITMLTAGQTLWKIGLERVGFSLSTSGIIKMFLNPFIFSGLAIYLLATVLWFYILSKAELSVAYPMQSLCYVFAAVVGLVFFKENVSLIRWAGLFLISAGAFLVSRG